jgi:hypothetical protein
LLYAVLGSRPDAQPLINITAIVLFAMGMVQFNALRKTLSRRKRFEKEELVADNAKITDKLLHPPNFADLVPESVTVHTTRQLAQDRKRE